MTYPHTRLNPTKLIKYYQRFEANPLKIFTSRDFSTNSPFSKQYLKVLCRLGLIEEVDALYRNSDFNRNIKAWRLKKEKR